MFDREEEMDRYLDEIKDMLRRKQYAAVRDLLLPLEPPAIAMLLEESGEEFMPLLYRLLPKELAAEVFVELESESQEMLINGFSKAFAMTGWRMGYLAADARLILPMLKVHQYAVASSNIIAQSAAITALQAGESCVEEMRREYARRRQFLLDAFAQIPEISCVAPAGTFYIYPNISGTGLSGTEFADKFLMEAGVATVPGTAFDSFCNSHIRLSYASSMESLQTAVSRLKGMLKK